VLVREMKLLLEFSKGRKIIMKLLINLYVD
jgi:hypothetical protein